MSDDDFIGDRFQELTKYSRTTMSGGARARRVEPLKEYAGARTVSLALEVLPEGGLWETLKQRRSRRSFSGAMSLEDLSRLAFAAQGVTQGVSGHLLRTAPSAGALYPFETYLVINAVEGIAAGVYHYNVRTASLELLREGGYGRPLSDAALGQNMCGRAAAVFCLTSVAGRCQWKYAQRGWRYIYLDAGHVGQNIYLAAQAMGLGCCAIGAFFDEEVNALLGVDGEEETAVYLLAAGPVGGDE